jgi:hypothetical protein
LKKHSIPLFDGSLPYAVEHIEADAEKLDALYAKAKKLAHSIPAPHYADTEHG